MIDRQRLLTVFLDLLQINSPSRQEGDVAAYARRELEKMGFQIRLDDAGQRLGGQTGNIVATLPGAAENAPRILLCAHMDTVQPTDGLRVIREDGVIRQEGAAVLGADDKAGIAAILEGVRSAIAGGARLGQIQVLLLICEEIGLLGSKHLDMSLVDSDFGYVFDSGRPVGHLVSEAPSHDNIAVEITGRAAHAGVCPEEGASAIRAAALAISRIPLGRIDHETTANVGVISGGTARNIVPEKCEVKAEARSRDESKLERQVALMRQAFEDAAREAGCLARIDISRQYRCYRHTREAPLVQLALRAAADAGLTMDLLPHGGGSDCNILNEKGLPCAVVGVGYDRIHTPEESITEDELVRCAELVRAIAVAAGDA